MDIYAVLAAIKRGECLPSHIYESLLALKLSGEAEEETTVNSAENDVEPVALE